MARARSRWRSRLATPWLRALGVVAVAVLAVGAFVVAGAEGAHSETVTITNPCMRDLWVAVSERTSGRRPRNSEFARVKGDGFRSLTFPTEIPHGPANWAVWVSIYSDGHLASPLVQTPDESGDVRLTLPKALC